MVKCSEGFFYIQYESCESMVIEIVMGPKRIILCAKVSYII